MNNDLLNPNPRWHYNFNGERIAEMAQKLSDEKGISFSNALQCIELEIKLNNYEIKDDQLHDLGKLLKEMIDTLNSIIESKTVEQSKIQG